MERRGRVESKKAAAREGGGFGVGVKVKSASSGDFLDDEVEMFTDLLHF